jgi:hypothetical protein
LALRARAPGGKKFRLAILTTSRKKSPCNSLSQVSAELLVRDIGLCPKSNLLQKSLPQNKKPSIRDLIPKPLKLLYPNCPNCPNSPPLRGSVAEAGGGELAKFNLLCPALALRARENQSYQSEICGHKQTLPWRSRGEKKKSGRLRGKPVGLITSPQQAWREIADLFNLQTGYNQIDVAVPSGNNIRSSLPRTRGNYMAGPDKAKLVSFRRCFSTAVQKLVTKSAELWKLLIKPKQYF